MAVSRAATFTATTTVQHRTYSSSTSSDPVYIIPGKRSAAVDEESEDEATELLKSDSTTIITTMASIRNLSKKTNYTTNLADNSNYDSTENYSTTVTNDNIRSSTINCSIYKLSYPIKNPPIGKSTFSTKFVRAFGIVLSHLVAFARPLENEPLTRFHSVKAPEISVVDYVIRIYENFNCSDECFVLALIYIDRVVKLRPNFTVTVLNIHRLLITAVMLAAKFFDDVYYTNSFYACVGGVTLQELNHLEWQFLMLIHFQLHVSIDEFLEYQNSVLLALRRRSSDPVKKRQLRKENWEYGHSAEDIQGEILKRQSAIRRKLFKGEPIEADKAIKPEPFIIMNPEPLNTDLSAIRKFTSIQPKLERVNRASSRVDYVSRGRYSPREEQISRGEHGHSVGDQGHRGDCGPSPKVIEHQLGPRGVGLGPRVFDHDPAPPPPQGDPSSSSSSSRQQGQGFKGDQAVNGNHASKWGQTYKVDRNGEQAFRGEFSLRPRTSSQRSAVPTRWRVREAKTSELSSSCKPARGETFPNEEPVFFRSDPSLLVDQSESVKCETAAKRQDRDLSTSCSKSETLRRRSLKVEALRRQSLLLTAETSTSEPSLSTINNQQTKIPEESSLYYARKKCCSQLSDSSSSSTSRQVWAQQEEMLKVELQKLISLYEEDLLDSSFDPSSSKNTDRP